MRVATHLRQVVKVVAYMKYKNITYCLTEIQQYDYGNLIIKQTPGYFPFSKAPLMNIKLVVLALGFNMKFFVGFYGPTVHQIRFKILAVRNLKRLRSTAIEHSR